MIWEGKLSIRNLKKFLLLKYFGKNGVLMYNFKAQDRIIDSSKNLNNKGTIENIIPKDINKTTSL